MTLLRTLAGIVVLAPAVYGGTAHERGRDLVLTKSRDPSELPVYTASRALIVGIDRYDKLPKEAQLRFAAADAKSVRDVLVASYGFPAANVKTLLDGEATLKNIRAALDDLADKRTVGSDDRILVYFSGHGQTVGGGKDERGYLVPTDAKVDLSDGGNAGAYKKTCLPMQEVWDRLDPSPAKHVAVVADACFSGLLTRSRGYAPPVGLGVYLTMPARQAITAGGRGQKTWEAEEYGHGVFTYNLVNELQKRAKRPGEAFSLVDLFASVQDPTVKMSKGRQVPQYTPFFTEGQMLFFAPGVSGRAVEDAPATNDAPRPATLRIRAFPQGARVTVDGEPATDGTAEFSESRTVKVRVEADGCVPQERTVAVKPGTAASLEVRLVKAKTLAKPQPSRLRVESVPSGATVKLDGKAVGTTPLSIDLKVAAPRSVSLTLEKPGYKAIQTTATFIPGSLSGRLTLDLESSSSTTLTTAIKGRRVASLSPEGETREFVASPDLKRAATVDANGTWTIYELPSGKILRRITEPVDGYVRLTENLRTLLTIRLMRNAEHSWLTVLAESVTGPSTARVYSVNLGKAGQMNYVGTANDQMVVCGREPGGRGAVAVLDLASGKSDSFTGSGSFAAGTATRDGKTLAMLLDAPQPGYASQLILLGDRGSLAHRTVSIEDSDVGRSVIVAPNGGSVLTNTGRRTADNRVRLQGFCSYRASDASLSFKTTDYTALGFLSDGRILGQTLDAQTGAILDAQSGNVTTTFPLGKTWASKQGRWIATLIGDRIELYEITSVH